MDNLILRGEIVQWEYKAIELFEVYESDESEQRNCMVGIHNTKGIKFEVYESVHQCSPQRDVCEESLYKNHC